MLRLGLFAAISTGVLATAAGHGTLAYFTSTVTSGSNTFVAGNLHFTIADNNETAATTVGTTIHLTNMKPGDVVFAPVSLANTGSVDAKWGIAYTTATLTGHTDLADALQLGVVAKGSGDGVVGQCTGSNFTNATHWAEQIVPTPANMTHLGQTIVNYASTQAPGAERVYTASDKTAGAYLPLKPFGTALAADADIVCVQITFPNGGVPVDNTSGDNAWNGATATYYDTTITLSFTGEQRELSSETVL
ncbi:MAG TPA: TasA family protein [Chloroflexota bacterium]|jgi:predicted ribosomally synthesized peptide with SipW-like signal peptide|nr:TasA family protein [Chloroflexota bacterium]